MAGSLRVALFATDPSDTAITQAQTWTPADNGKFCYDPYGTKKYVGGSWVADEAPGKIYATQEGAYANAMSTDLLSTTWNGKYITAPVANAFGTNGIQALTATYSSLSAATTAHTQYEIAEITAGQMTYLRLVVWFDGEDEACITSFAGGGAKVEINFGLEAATVEG